MKWTKHINEGWPHWTSGPYTVSRVVVAGKKSYVLWHETRMVKCHIPDLPECNRIADDHAQGLSRASSKGD